VAAEIESQDGRAVVAPTDVSAPQSVERLVACGGAKIRFAPRETRDLQAGRQFWHPTGRRFDPPQRSQSSTRRAEFALYGSRESIPPQNTGFPIRPNLRTLRARDVRPLPGHVIEPLERGRRNQIRLRPSRLRRSRTRALASVRTPRGRSPSPQTGSRVCRRPGCHSPKVGARPDPAPPRRCEGQRGRIPVVWPPPAYEKFRHTTPSGGVNGVRCSPPYRTDD
jgi:hypothetical protein